MRVLQPAVDEDDHHDDEQDEEVEADRVRDLDGQGRARDGRDAARPVGDVDRLVEVVGEDTDHLAEAQGHDGQVVAAEPEHGEPEQHAGAGRHGETDHQERIEPPGGQGKATATEEHIGVRRAEDRPRVGADGEEGDVAEVEQPRQAHDDVEPERQRHEDADLRGDFQVIAVVGADHRHEHEQRGREQCRAQPARDPCDVGIEQARLEDQEEQDRAGEEGDGGAGEGYGRHRRRGADHARSRTTSPRRPFGRKIRIRMRTEKAKMSLYSAPKAPPVSSDK